MTMFFKCSNPNQLRQAFVDKVNLGNKPGGIASWTIDAQGKITHVATQLEKAGDLITEVIEDTQGRWLAFNFKPRKGVNAKDAQFAFKELSGNILATFIEHFLGQFSEAKFLDRRPK
ncbi:hypothetical protein VPH13_02795 [Stenotrophomonas pavanii]|uniref:hypothetical protein n=1 Tax=Stenotrophomonas pavanii TaxID=487698 RepID=UPI002DB85751|nr:hypothetical protein [Stenotrophomonas pavanii]MEC4337652.1 hypothetical protein [Stenotrophomonas pavanii]